MYVKVQNKLKKLLEQVCSVSLTTDLWTSHTTDSYNSVTIHFFNPNTETLEAKILECAPFDSDHSGKELAKDIEKILVEFGVLGKISAGISDHASNVKLAFRELGLPWQGCLAHNLNLIFKDGYDACWEISELGKKFCGIVASYRVS